jgi:hypothetical protein
VPWLILSRASASSGLPALSAGQLRRPLPDRRGDEKFADRVDEDLAGVRAGDGALVGDREDPHLTDLVAPELDTDRGVRGAGEDVEDAAAGGELAPAADDVGVGVAELHEALLHGAEVQFLPFAQPDRLNVPESRHDRLDRGPGRGDEDPHLTVGDPVEDRHALCDGLDPRRQPLVRQGLPGGEQFHPLTEHGGQFGGEVLGLASGGGDDGHRRVLCERAEGEGPGGLRPLDVEATVTDVRHQPRQFRIFGDGTQDAGQGCGAHGVPS